MKQVLISKWPQVDYAYQEAINALCTNLTFCGTQNKVILLTSQLTGDGKTSLTMGIARTFAILGKRVALVDGDLRCSYMRARFGFQFETNEAYGLSHFLAGMCETEDVIYATNETNLFLIPAGREVGNSLQLIASPRLSVLLKSLRDSFDFVLVDSAPIGEIIDGAEIAKSCDGALIIASYNQGTYQGIASIAQTINKTGCNVLGVVLNNVDFGAFSNRKYYYKSGLNSYYHRLPEETGRNRKARSKET